MRRSRDEGQTWETVDNFRTAGSDRWRAQTPYAAALVISVVLAIAILIAAMYYFRATERIFADII